LKVDIDSKKANRIINHGPVVLVTSGGSRNPNILTIAWSMPVSKDPPYVAVSIGDTRYSHKLIVEKNEFVICVPPASLIDQVWRCGKTTGATADKFKDTGLHPAPSMKVETPGIQECIANLECRVVDRVSAGDHTVFIGEVVRAEDTDP
jgi:flavin reductase (DIM6/NTAB) family NADH-FMN oxidoreductase RutF